MCSDNKLYEIPREDWSELRDLYRENWPKNEIAYNVVQNIIDWIIIDSNVRDLKVYSYDKKWRQHGTYIILDRYQMFIDTLDDTNEALKKALMLIDWSYGFILSCYYEKFRPTVYEVIESLQLEVQFDVLTYEYWISKEKAEKFNIMVPKGTELGSLKGVDTSKPNNLWPFKGQGTAYYVKRLAEWNKSSALFSKTDRELLSWVFRFQSGAFGILQVDDKHYRKGYGEIVIKALSKENAQNGFNSYGFIVDDNTASINLFKKLGFKNVGNIFWLKVKTTKNIDWDDNSKAHY